MKTTTNYSYDFMRNVTKIETKDESGFYMKEQITITCMTAQKENY